MWKLVRAHVCVQVCDYTGRAKVCVQVCVCVGALHVCICKRFTSGHECVQCGNKGRACVQVYARVRAGV